MYRITATKGNAEWIQTRGVPTLIQAEEHQAWLYEQFPGTDFTIERESDAEQGA